MEENHQQKERWEETRGKDGLDQKKQKEKKAEKKVLILMLVEEVQFQELSGAAPATR